MNLDRNVFFSHTRVIVVKIIAYALLALSFCIFVKPSSTELTTFLLVVFILGEGLFITTNYWEHFQASFLTKLKNNLTEVFTLLGVLFWGFIFFSKSVQTTDLSLNIIENYLALLIGVLALGVPFFLDVISRISKEWHGNIARSYAYSRTNKYFAGYLVLSVILSFFLLFSLKSMSILENTTAHEFTLFDYFLLTEVVLFVLALAAFLAKSFKDYSAPEGNIIKYYNKYLQELLVKSSHKVPYTDPTPSFLREKSEKPQNKISEFLFSILNYIHSLTYFIDGKVKLYKLQYLLKGHKYSVLDKNMQNIFPQLKTLYRVANNKLASEQFDSLEQVFISLLELNEFYISRSGFTVASFDKYFSGIMIPETKQLYEKALQTNYQDGLETIVHFVGKTALMLLSNVTDKEFQYNQAMPSSGLEDLLNSFCIKSFMKEDSPATSIAIDYLKQISLIYAQNGEFIKASLSFRNLSSLSEFFAELPRTLKPLKPTKPHMIQWAQSKCLQTVKSSIDILSLNLEVGTACKDHYWRQFAEEVLRGFQENLVKLHKASLEAETQVGWEYYVPIFDEVRGIILRIEDREKFNDEQRESLYFLFPDLFWRLVNISAEANALKNDSDRNDNAPKKDHVQAIMFLFGSMMNIYKTTQNDRLKGEIERILSKYSTLFDKNISFLERTFHPVNCIDEFSVIIATSIIYYDESNCFQELLKKSIQNIIEYFETYNDENDQFKHKRRHIYKRLLLYGVWLKKHLIRKGGVYNKIRRFLIEKVDFMEGRPYGMGGWKPFPECDYSDSFGRIDKIWRLKDKEFYITRFDEEFLQKATEFDSGVENSHWDFLKTIEG